MNFGRNPPVAERWPHKTFTDLFTRESVKIIKSNEAHRGWFSIVLYLAPGTAADQIIASGRYPGLGSTDVKIGDLCPHKTRGCFGEYGENCIFTTGQLALPDAQQAMVARTYFMRKYPQEFMALLYHEIDAAKRYAAKHGRKLAVRLNGTSDIRWEKIHPEIFRDFPDVQLYDYTKLWERFLPKGGQPPPPLPRNYHLTFSRSEENDPQVEQIIKQRIPVNVAMVFETRPKIGVNEKEPLPPRAFGREIIDGDLHDLRFLDDPPTGVIVGLRAKGALRREVKERKSLFVVYNDNENVTAHRTYVRPGRPFDGFSAAPEGYIRVGVLTGRDTVADVPPEEGA